MMMFSNISCLLPFSVIILHPIHLSSILEIGMAVVAHVKNTENE
jgi:hypothetical protein